MRFLRVLREAEDELADAARWYESKRVGLGVELIVEVDRAFEEIRSAPMSHALWRADRPYRWKVLLRFPYLVFFSGKRRDGGDHRRSAREAAPGVLDGANTTIARERG